MPVRNEFGAITEWVGSITDIHDRKQTEDMLRRTEKLNAAARIAASIAHEINNPLTYISGNLDLALASCETLPEAPDQRPRPMPKMKKVAAAAPCGLIRNAWRPSRSTAA